MVGTYAEIAQNTSKVIHVKNSIPKLSMGMKVVKRMKIGWLVLHHSKIMSDIEKL